MIEIKSRWNGSTIYKSDKDTVFDAVVEAALRSADLSSANLSGADLSGADLSSANLRSADLSSANLSGANLRSANLRSAALSGADLSSADLSSADLRSADLRSAKNIPPVVPMPEIKAEILKRVESNPNCLNMGDWHSCETTHCLAGWATTLHPQGQLLESLIGVRAAAGLIFNASLGEIPSFYSSNDQAIDWLKAEVSK